MRAGFREHDLRHRFLFILGCRCAKGRCRKGVDALPPRPWQTKAVAWKHGAGCTMGAQGVAWHVSAQCKSCLLGHCMQFHFSPNYKLKLFKPPESKTKVQGTSACKRAPEKQG